MKQEVIRRLTIRHGRMISEEGNPVSIYRINEQKSGVCEGLGERLHPLVSNVQESCVDVRMMRMSAAGDKRRDHLPQQSS